MLSKEILERSRVSLFTFSGYSGKGIKTLIQNIHQHLQLYETALSLWTAEHNIVTTKRHI